MHSKKIAKQNKKNNDVSNINETTLNPDNISRVELNDPIVLDFCRALKRQKVFGSFCCFYKLKSLSQTEKKYALNTEQPIWIDNIIFNACKGSFFLKRLKILNRMIVDNGYNHSHRASNMSIQKAFGYYAKEYFKDKKYLVKHSILYYQILFGTISSIIGLITIFALINYFWGKLVLGIILLLTCIYFCIAIHKLRNINLF